MIDRKRNQPLVSMLYCLITFSESFVIKRRSEASESFSCGFWRWRTNSWKILNLLKLGWCLSSAWKRLISKVVTWELVAIVNANYDNIFYKTRLFCSSLFLIKESNYILSDVRWGVLVALHALRGKIISHFGDISSHFKVN